MVPSSSNLVPEALEHRTVAGDSKVAVVPSQLRAQLIVLVGHGLVSIRPAPLPHSLQRAGQPRARCPALDYRASFPGLPPVMGETEKLEARWRFSFSRRPFCRTGRLETKQPRLVGREPEAGLAESLRQHLLPSPRVVLPLAYDHEVVRVPNQPRRTAQPSLDFGREPNVQ